MDLGLLQIILYLAVVLAFTKPLGHYIANVYENKTCGLDRLLKPFERLIYRVCKIQPQVEMNWSSYLVAMLLFNLIGILMLYGLTRLQGYLALNPQSFLALRPDLAFNTAISFVANTNWQAYSGEKTLSYLTEILGLTVQNFLSAATGLSLLMAFIRGLIRQETILLGNFWVDIVKATLYIFLPLSILWAIALVSQGVIQNFKPYQTVNSFPVVSDLSTAEPLKTLGKLKAKGASQRANSALKKGETSAARLPEIPMGPAASQIAIKQLGTNGGGFFNTNSAHPFENPTPFSNFLEMLAIFLIPAALCYTFGVMVKDRRQGWVLLIVMFILFTLGLGVCLSQEQQGNPLFTTLTRNQDLASNGNMEGKETRVGIVNSAIWAVATTATANGSVNAMLDSFMPLGRLIPLLMMQLGEVVLGGVGSGLYDMLIFVIITVFLTGLMVGRTPEYLGKKIEPFEMKMACLVILIMPFLILVFSAISAVSHAGIQAIGNPGAAGFTEILYAFSSMGHNNGSALAGLNANTPFYNTLGGIVMLMGRYWIAIPVIAIAGSLASKKTIPTSKGTLPTHTPLFIILLVSVILLIGMLAFFPALSLGPIVEHFVLWGQHAKP